MKEFEDDYHTKKERKAERRLSSARDRSKFKKTDLEKRKLQIQKAQQRRLSKKTLLRGRVINISPEGFSVADETKVYLCALRGSLKSEFTQMKNLVAVGDFVLFEPENESSGSIAYIEERSSILSREEHLRRRQQQIIAANIDQVLITVSVVKPSLKPSLIDRYIIASYKGNMEPIIVINKVDLLGEAEKKRDLFEEVLETYSKLEIPVIAVSAVTSTGLNALQKQMQNRASVFAGQSGVGKSSLINAMTGLNLPTGEVVAKTQKGSHTTTKAQLIPLSCGGWCIDTPGIRSFGVWDLKWEDLTAYFFEISALSDQCYYPNCTHSHEPGCALEQALEKKEISPLRVDSYFKLLQEIKERT